VRVKFSDLQSAFEYVDVGVPGTNEAWLDRRTGAMHFWSDYDDDEEQKLSADIEDETRYLAIPDKRDLGLGRRLAIDFAF
jgi:hypothetical protein